MELFFWHSRDLICFAPQLDIMEPKVPDDIYKTHLENNSKSVSKVFLTERVCLQWLSC